MLTLFLLGCRALNAADGVADRVADPDKIIHDYEWFHTASTRVESRVAQVAATREMIAAEADAGEVRRLKVELAGQQQSCRELVADYNANAQKMTVGIFKGWSLPDSIDPNECE